jgi:hypothetical protein
MSLAGSFCISIDLLKGRSDHPYSGCDARSLISLCIPCISRKLDSEEATNLSSDAGFVALLKTIFIYFRWIEDESNPTLSQFSATEEKKAGPPILGALMLRVLEKICLLEIPLAHLVLLDMIEDCTVVICSLLQCGFTEDYQNILIVGATFREEAESLMSGRCVEFVSITTRYLLSLQPSPNGNVRIIRGNLTRNVANALLFEFDYTTRVVFAQAVLGKTKLLNQIIKSIRYSLMLILSYTDEHTRSCNCVAESAIDVIEHIGLFLPYPQINSILSNKIELIRALESKCAVFPDEFKKIVDGFLIRYEEVVGDSARMKCENPLCSSSNPASKSCSICGVRYCSRECQIEHWKLPESPHKDVCSEDSLFQSVVKIYVERVVANDPGYFYYLDFKQIPLELYRVGDYRDLCMCQACEGGLGTGCEVGTKRFAANI